MPVNFEWNDDYSVGVEEIDSQHKRFLQLIREAYALKQSGADNSRIQALLVELDKYLVFHTKSEELLMILYSYPQYEKQREEHSKLIQQVKEDLKTLPDNPDGLTDLMIFLMKWFVNHTTYLDKDLGSHILQQRTV